MRRPGATDWRRCSFAVVVVLALATCQLAAACNGSGGGASASPSPSASLDTAGAEQALWEFAAATLPGTDDPYEALTLYELVRIDPAEEAPPPWEVSYRVEFTTHPGVASSVSGTGTRFAVFFLARDAATGAWRVWPKSWWVRKYVTADASQ